MKKKLLIAVPLLALVALAAWFFRPKHESLGEAYVSEKSVTLWSSMAQVREPIGTLRYGDRVDMQAKRNDFVKVKTVTGAVGWVDGRLLMDPALWQRCEELLKRAETLPVQASGRTKVATNLRVEPGRTAPRLYQFSRGVPVQIVARAVADWSQVSDEKEASEPQEAKKEDWFLIRGLATRPPGESSARTAGLSNTTEPGDQTVPIAGWVIARFLELDVPDPVREGSNAANLRPIAWFELNRVEDPSGQKQQYLLAAARGAEGQACDFSVLRVYTWNRKKTRYETAFIENNLCGTLPIRVGRSGAGQPEFRFMNADDRKNARVYRLIQTVVRRVREGDDTGKVQATGKSRAKAH
jgi:Bacterial SH3 domain